MSIDSKRQITIEWDDISPSLMIAAERTGLEYMQAIMTGEAPPPPIARLLNMQPIEVSHGRAVFAGIPGEQHFNPMGTVHGGFAATLLDSALGCAVHTTLPQGVIYSTVQLNVNMTRPIMPDVGRVICAADVLHGGSKVATAEATLTDEDGKLYAHGTATCFIYPMELKRRA